jgi:hypothetical protein
MPMSEAVPPGEMVMQYTRSNVVVGRGQAPRDLPSLASSASLSVVFCSAVRAVSTMKVCRLFALRSTT